MCGCWPWFQGPHVSLQELTAGLRRDRQFLGAKTSLWLKARQGGVIPTNTKRGGGGALIVKLYNLCLNFENYTQLAYWTVYKTKTTKTVVEKEQRKPEKIVVPKKTRKYSGSAVRKTECLRWKYHLCQIPQSSHEEWERTAPKQLGSRW